MKTFIISNGGNLKNKVACKKCHAELLYNVTDEATGNKTVYVACFHCQVITKV